MIKNNAFTSHFSTKQKPTLWTGKILTNKPVLSQFHIIPWQVAWACPSYSVVKGNSSLILLHLKQTNKQTKPPGFLDYHPLLYQINMRISIVNQAVFPPEASLWKLPCLDDDRYYLQKHFSPWNSFSIRTIFPVISPWLNCFELHSYLLFCLIFWIKFSINLMCSSKPCSFVTFQSGFIFNLFSLAEKF